MDEKDNIIKEKKEEKEIKEKKDSKEAEEKKEEKKVEEEKKNEEIKEKIVEITKEQILCKTAKEYFDSGEDELKKNRFNSALVLFFKSLIALTDLYIYQKTKNTPSSHVNRFKITKEKFEEVYNIIDKDFPHYQDSYVQLVSKELVEVIRDDAKIMAEKTQIKL